MHPHCEMRSTFTEVEWMKFYISVITNPVATKVTGVLNTPPGSKRFHDPYGQNVIMVN